MIVNNVSSVVIHNGPTFLSQQIILGLNALGYGISLVAPHSHYHVDLLGTGAFALSTVPSLLAAAAGKTADATAAPPSRIVWTSVAVATWSVKLAGYLLYRVVARGGDARMNEIMEHPVYAAGFWAYSALWGIVCSLPYSLGLGGTTAAGNPLLLTAGLGIFGVGLAIETAADYQKYVFRKEHPGKFCNTGVWSISQHPNYFGNIVLWLGILVANSSVLYVPPPATATDPTVWERIWACRRWAVALIGPAFMMNLFYSQAQGTLLADSFQAERKKYGYGTDPVYTKYIDGTYHDII